MTAIFLDKLNDIMRFFILELLTNKSRKKNWKYHRKNAPDEFLNHYFLNIIKRNTNFSVFVLSQSKDGI